MVGLWLATCRCLSSVIQRLPHSDDGARRGERESVANWNPEPVTCPGFLSLCSLGVPQTFSGFAMGQRS